MLQESLWSRRKFSKAMVSLQLLVGSGALILPACSPDTKQSTDKPNDSFDGDRKDILRLAMDEIIPKSEKMPSASEVGGVDYILGVFEEYTDLLPAFNQVLDALNAQSHVSNGKDFSSVGMESRINTLKEFEKFKPDLFRVLRDMVYESYYLNEKVWAIIGYEPYPTLQAGPEMEPFNEGLLERVKQLPPFYTNPNR